MAEDAKWYVIHTYSGYENAVAAAIMKAAENRRMQDLIQEVNIPYKARTQLLKSVTYEDGDVRVGSSTKFTNVPNSDNNVYYLVITGSVNKSELFNFYDGGVYIF